MESTHNSIRDTKMKSAHDLTTALSKRFLCMHGPARAYFEIPISEALTSETVDPRSGSKLRVVYSTVILAFYGTQEQASDHEGVLAQAIFDSIEKCVEAQAPGFEDQELVLFWRRLPTYEYGHSYDSGAGRGTVRVRFAIPGIDLRFLSVSREEGGAPARLKFNASGSASIARD